MYYFMCFYFIDLLLYMFTLRIQGYELRPMVNTTLGIVVGVKIYPDSSREAVNAYLGIPYAEPPQNHLRFSVPEKHRGWNKTLFANQVKPICPFRVPPNPLDENEDCLYLNIWISETININQQLLPVIVYFEMEHIINNQLIRVPGHDLATAGVAAVSVTYRRNIFGFFCLGSAMARGNLGLLDQYMALLWIKENISKFGGDPKRITIMGYYSSALTIVYQIMSPKTIGLFSRAIIMSDNEVVRKNLSDPILISKELMEDLGCSMFSLRKSLTCLRSKSTGEIIQSFQRHVKDDKWHNSVMPVNDKFLSEYDQYLPFTLQEGIRQDIPILTGILDSSSNINWANGNVSNVAQAIQYAEEISIPTLLQHYDFDDSMNELVKNVLRWKYLWSNGANIHLLMKNIEKMEWDARIAAPYQEQLTFFINSSHAPVYVYCAHNLNTFPNNTLREEIGSDLLLLFGPVLMQQTARRRFLDFERELSNYMKRMWITFAKYGKPVESTIHNHQKIWKPYNQQNRFIHFIGFNDTKNHLKDFHTDINLWNELLPVLATNMNSNKQLQFQTLYDPSNGLRHTVYILIGLIIALLALLIICTVLLKRKIKDNNRHIYI